MYYSPECEVDYNLLQLFQRDRLFTRFTDSAVDCVGDDNCLVNIFLTAIDAQDERRSFDMVLAHCPATKTTGRMRGTVTVNAVHFSCLPDVQHDDSFLSTQVTKFMRISDRIYLGLQSIKMLLPDAKRFFPWSVACYRNCQAYP